MRNIEAEHTAKLKEREEMLAILEKCQPEQKNYIAGVIDGMNAERRLSENTQRPARPCQ